MKDKDIQKKEQELSDINKKVNALKKKSEAVVSDIKKLEGKKASLTDKIENIKREITIGEDRKGLLTKEMNIASKALSEQQAKLTQEKQTTENLQEILNLNTKEYNAKQAKLEQAKKDLSVEKDILKQDQQVFDAEKNKFYSKTKHEHERELNTIALKKEQELDILKKETAKVKQASAELDIKVKTAEAVQENSQLKIQETERVKQETEALKQQYQTAKDSVDKHLSELKQARAEADIQKKECESAKESFQRQIQALDTREKEIKIKELRVRKLIKDNQLDKELKQLEESLK
jgi:chromosome segregation ATPase